MEFEKADFFNFKDEYTSRITDLPTTYIGFIDKGKTKIVRDYHGAPQLLSDLEAKLEIIANSDEGWEIIE